MQQPFNREQKGNKGLEKKNIGCGASGCLMWSRVGREKSASTVSNDGCEIMAKFTGLRSWKNKFKTSRKEMLYRDATKHSDSERCSWCRDGIYFVSKRLELSHLILEQDFCVPKTSFGRGSLQAPSVDTNFSVNHYVTPRSYAVTSIFPIAAQR